MDGSARRLARLIAAIAAAAIATMALASTASAKTLFFVGEADDDAATTIQFTAKGHYEKSKKKNKKKFVGKQVSSIRVYDQQFVCYDANGAPTGYSGRATYGEFAFIDPLEVEKGHFGGFDQQIYQSPYGAPPVTLHFVTFRGQIKNKKATGAYQAKHAEGGIEFGYCGDKNPVDWTAKAQKNAPEPPPDPLE
jgi:hypothetical protein